MPVRERLGRVFAATLALGPDDDVEGLQQRVHLNWDSVSHIALVMAIEDEFDVEFGPNQALHMDSFEAALKTLRELGVEG